MPWFGLPKLSFSSTALYSAVWAAYVFFILPIMKCPDSVVTVTDFQEQTQLPIDWNLPNTVSHVPNSEMERSFVVSLPKHPGSTIIRGRVMWMSIGFKIIMVSSDLFTTLIKILQNVL